MIVMSELSMQDLDHVMKLAHLNVEPSRREPYLKQLQNVLSYMDQLKQLNVDSITPSSHALNQSTRLRDDVVVVQPDLLLEKNAPYWEGNAFRVPKILG